MCFDCQRHWREEHEKAKAAANEHFDAEGVPEDSLVRGVAEVQMACNLNPILAVMMRRCWPSLENLMQ